MTAKLKSKDKGGKPTSARLLRNRPPDPEESHSMAMEEQEAEAQEPIQGQLIADSEVAAIEPSAVQNDRIAATYLGDSKSREKDTAMVYLDFSFTLTNEHKKFVPDKVADAQTWLTKNDNKLVGVNHLPAQTVDVFLSPNEKSPELHLVGAEMTKATVSMIEETGKGKTKKVVRFKFSLLVERDRDLKDFTWENDDKQFWLTLEDTQQSLLK